MLLVSDSRLVGGDCVGQQPTVPSCIAVSRTINVILGALLAE